MRPVRPHRGSLVRLAPGLPLLLLVACRDAPTSSAAPPAASAALALPTAVASSSSPAPAVPSSAPPPVAPVDTPSRLASARAALTPPGVAQLLPHSFILVAPTSGPLFSSAVTLATQELGYLVDPDRFPRAPPDGVTVFVLPTTGEYAKVCNERFGGRGVSDVGYTESALRELAVNVEPAGLGTMAHEIVHSFVREDFGNAPKWFNEGLAALFETAAFPRPGELRIEPSWRRRTLLDALKATETKETTRIDVLFTMSDVAFEAGDKNVHYALARFFVAWLESRGELWTFYRAWRQTFVDDPTGTASFVKVVGKTPDDANAEWKTWVLSTR